MNKLHAVLLGAVVSASAAATAKDKEMTVEMHAVSDQGVEEMIGQITVRETEEGLVFDPELQGLEPGIHGFHVHENPDCGARGPEGDQGAAKAAGGHMDPEDAGQHAEPWSEQGHKGDLPALYVEDDRSATQPVHVVGLEMSDLEGRSLMIHAGGDNYADEPEPLGGGGDRVACGVISGN